MITPLFSVTQDDDFIYIDVKVTHLRFSAQNIEMSVDDNLFIFSLNPYYIRIRLPYPLLDDERSHARYDSPTECVKIKIPKLTPGQHFPDLDLTTKLLARSTVEEDIKKSVKKPLIEEIDVTNASIATDSVDQVMDEGEKFNWEISQTAKTEELVDGDVTLSNIKYGFNNQYEQIVLLSMSNGNDINELGDPETTPVNDRIIERLIKENIKFDPEFYASDYIMEKYPMEGDDKQYKTMIEWKNPVRKKFLSWYKAQQALPESERQQIMKVEFSKEEQKKMIDLPRKSYIIGDSYKPQLLMLILSLLFSYHFDLRENDGDHTIESAWTIGKLTPQFSCLDSQIVIDNQDNLIKSTIITGIRRALSFPYHRNYNVCIKAWDDVYYNLRGGKRLILKSLLKLKELFRFHDVYYIYDKIWLEDLCTWIISDNLSEGTIRNLAHDMNKVHSNLQKSDITFEKADETMDEDEDNIVALNLQEIEQIAEDLYNQSIQ